MDLVIVAAAGVMSGPLWGVAPMATLAAMTLSAFAFGADRRGRTLAISLIVFGVAAGASWARAERAQGTAHARGARAFAEVGPRSCEVEGTIDTSPTRRRGAMRVVIRVSHATCDASDALGDSARLVGAGARDLTVGERVVVYVDAAELSTRDLARGDRVSAHAALAPPEKLWNPEVGDPWPRLARADVWATGSASAFVVVARGRGPAAYTDRARAHVRARIDATFLPLAAPMARALVLGESDLDAAEDDAFRTSGLAHLLAVSGMHLVLVVLGFERALRFALARVTPWAARHDTSRAAAAAALPLAWAYADFAGASGSAVRAAWMLTALLGARALGRRSTAPRALALSALALALIDPLAAFDISLTLSLAATAGLVAFGARLADWLDGAGKAAPSSLLARSLGATTAATIPCAPLLASMGTTLPLGGAFANVVAVPLGEVAALPLCLFHTLLAPLPALERGCAVAASAMLLAVRSLAHTCASVPWLALTVPSPTPLQAAALLTAVAVSASPHRRRRRWAVGACFLLSLLSEVALREHARPRGLVRVTMFDVGQGDSILVDLPNGEALLVDGGGLVGSPTDVGARVLAPALRARRRDELAAVVLSHPHPDHYGGLPSGTRAVRVREIWNTGQSAHGGSRSAEAVVDGLVQRGARLLEPSALCGERVVGGARVQVLAPCPSVDPDRGANDNSFVLRISYGARSILFVGDAERDAERDLVRRYGSALASDVLKVGHHGSATSSTPAFLAAVAPKLALVSSGVRNRFGHPRAETLAALEAQQVRVLRTDRDGQLVVETDGRSLSFATARFTP